MDPSLAGQFEAWLTAAVGRVSPPLEFREIRRAVQAVSTLYVERRPSAGLGARTRESDGKRAALSTYYAPLHFLTALRAAEELPETMRGQIRRIHDLGCGTGVVGAAFARACPGRVEVEGLDRSGWALREARFTFSAFGVRGRTRRASLPGSLPTLKPGDALAFGWMANELEGSVRADLLRFVERAVGAGCPLLVLEPLGTRHRSVVADLGGDPHAAGVRDLELKFEPELPDWIRRLDDASGLDHRVLGARVLVAPG